MKNIACAEVVGVLPTLSGKLLISHAEFPRYPTGAPVLYWQQYLPFAQEIISYSVS
jgi:hypothetical protein